MYRENAHWVPRRNDECADTSTPNYSLPWKRHLCGEGDPSVFVSAAGENLWRSLPAQAAWWVFLKFIKDVNLLGDKGKRCCL